MLRMADKIHESGKKFDNVEDLSTHYLDLYQRLLTAEPLSREEIKEHWGKTGLKVVDSTIGLEQMEEHSDGVLRVVSPDGNIYLGKQVVSKLMEHNAREYHDSQSLSDLDAGFMRIFFLEKDLAKEAKAKAEELYAFIDKHAVESEKNGEVVFAMQTLFRTIFIKQGA